MGNWYRFIAVSQHPFARFARRVYHGLRSFSIPAPKLITLPVLTCFLLLRECWYFICRVFFCEPLFKAYCTQYGRNLHTGASLHWVQGRGELIIGDNVSIDGRCHIFFAARYSERPQLKIGDNTGIGHHCSFTVGKAITIGKHCRLASSIQMFDTPGHPSDAEARKAGEPARLEDVRPIVIGDNVWIGSNSIVYPGVMIGDNAIVALGSVVMSDVPENTLVAGNPARKVRALTPTP